MLGGMVCAIGLRSYAATEAGFVESCVGAAEAIHERVARPLEDGAKVFIEDLVSTHQDSRLVLLLGAATRIRMGRGTRLRIDKFLTEAKGEFTFESGPLLLEHEGPPPHDLRLRSPYGIIAVRGTRVFAGPSNGKFGVFVERGVVDFTAGGATVRLEAGLGSDVRRPGEKPSAPSYWKPERAVEALQSVY